MPINVDAQQHVTKAKYRSVLPPPEVEPNKIQDAANVAVKETKKAYLYSSGGGGHKAVKDALIEREPADGTVKTVERDVLHDFLGKVGQNMSKVWDDAQLAGNVEKIKQLASMQWISDLIFGPIIFLMTLRFLVNERPDELHSTQAMALPSIAHAVNTYNHYFRNEGDPALVLNQHMTDLPTVHADHFFRPIREIAASPYAPSITLWAPEPIEDGFYNTTFGAEFVESQIKRVAVSELPVRQAFKRAAKEHKYDPKKVELKIHGQAELDLLRSVPNLDLPDAPAAGDGNFTIDYQVGEDDPCTFLMLGSKPTHSTIEAYVEAMIEKAKADSEQTHHLFAFTGPFGKECYFKDLVAKLQAKSHEIPTNLKVVPITYQDAPQLVDLYLRSDTITRSGGSTCFELLMVKEIEDQLGIQRERMVHAAVEGPNPAKAEMRDALYTWEGGNYDYISQKGVNASMITPAILNPVKPAREEPSLPPVSCRVETSYAAQMASLMPVWPLADCAIVY